MSDNTVSCRITSIARTYQLSLELRGMQQIADSDRYRSGRMRRPRLRPMMVSA